MSLENRMKNVWILGRQLLDFRIVILCRFDKIKKINLEDGILPRAPKEVGIGNSKIDLLHRLLSSRKNR